LVAVGALAEAGSVDPGAAETLEIRMREGSWLGQPVAKLGLHVAAVEELIQHVDHQRLADQAHRTIGVFAARLREQRVATAIDEWRGDRGGAGAKNDAAGGHLCY